MLIFDQTREVVAQCDFEAILDAEVGQIDRRCRVLLILVLNLDLIIASLFELVFEALLLQERPELGL